MRKHSKRYREAVKLIERNKIYSLKEAISILKNMPRAKFDEALELSFQLNVDPKRSDQMVRGTVVLPHGTGKKIKVAVFCKGEHEKEAKEAGADFIGANELIDKVNNGWMDFDCAIATPEMMKELSKLGKILGPRGLMPSPKTGTVTNNVAEAIKDVKAGKIEFKVDKLSGMHTSVGKISFSEGNLYENATKLIEAILLARPSSVKGQFIKSSSISTTMSPGLKIKI